MEEVLNAHPRISQAFWRETMIDAAVFRNWVSLGQRPAYERLAAHAFWELAYRLKAVHWMRGDSLPFR